MLKVLLEDTFQFSLSSGNAEGTSNNLGHTSKNIVLIMEGERLFWMRVTEVSKFVFINLHNKE